MEIQKQKQEKLEQEKSLDEVIQEKGLNYSPEEINEKVELIKKSRGYKSEKAAKEYMKQSIVSNKSIDKEIESNEQGILKNYHSNLVQKLGLVARKEEKTMNSLIEPFIKNKKLVPEKSSLNALKLAWYKFIGMKKKYLDLYKELEKDTTITYLNKRKNRLRANRHKANRLLNNFEESYKNNRVNMRDYEKKLRKISSEISMCNKSKKKLEYEKTELEKMLDDSETLEEKDNVSEEYHDLIDDIEIINEESYNLYEDSKLYRTDMLEFKKEALANRELRKFYRRVTNSYERHVKMLSDLIDKTKKGMSYREAHKIAKQFVKDEGIFSEYISNRKELLKNGDIDLDLKPINIKDSLPEPNFKKRTTESICIENAPEDINSFLKKIKRY